MCIAQPELDEEGMAALNAKIADVINGTGGEVLSTEVLGRRRLAFPIRKKTDGVYVLTYAKLDTPGIAELEHRLRLTEEVIRFLLVRPDEDEIPVPGENEAVTEEEVEESVDEYADEDESADYAAEEDAEDDEE